MAVDTADQSHHDLKNPDGSWKYTNALARENSPYLLQHAHNPVDWHAWGPEAFDKARREQKPIFLSIGYSTCYWCHVMERQSFENPAIAAVMNEYFVNIKVDREERPDVDDLYMTATQMMTRRGGWPMSVFLTPPGAGGEDDPGLKPYYAGTYFPPEPGHGMPGFPQLVESLGKAWRERRGDVLQQAETVAAAVREQLEHTEAQQGPIGVEGVQRAANQLLRLYDQEHGGFGGAPKFPTPAYLFFLLEVHRNNPDAQLWQAMSHTLDRMARGGMYDQVGGGFHRYSVDERWLVPHFEKMLYDNGQLVELYALAIEHRPDAPEAAEHARIVRESCEYVLREMTDSTGAFWSAQDAEVNAKEGGNYVWTREEVEAAIEEAELRELAMAMYGLDLGPNFEDPHAPDATPVNVLFLPRPLGQLAAERGLTYEQILERRRQVNAILKAARDRREQPGTDDKALAAWNGMMIAGLATAGRVLEEPRYVEAAGRAAEAVVRHMSELASQGGLLRSMRKGNAKIPAFLEDYAFFVHGLVALHRAQPGNTRWLHWAKSYTQVAQSRFEAPGGGYYDTLPDRADLFVRLRSVHDGAIPSGNAQMIHNLLDLHALTNDRALADRAVRDLRSFSDELEQNGANMSYMQAALLRALDVAQEELAAGEGTMPASTRAAVTVGVEPAAIDGTRGEASLTLVMDIGEGFHINAPDAGEGLVPTSVELRGPQGVTLGVRFPPPEEKRFPFAEGRLRIYEGVVRLPVTLSWGEAPLAADELTLVVSYQACTETACLAPQRAEVSVRVE